MKINKRTFYALSAGLVALFCILEALVVYYWSNAQPFKFTNIFIIIFAGLSVVIFPNLNSIFLSSRFLYVIAQTFVFASFGGIVGVVAGDLLLVPFLTVSVGGEIRWLSFVSFWMFLISCIAGLVLGFGLSLCKALRGAKGGRS